MEGVQQGMIVTALHDSREGFVRWGVVTACEEI